MKTRRRQIARILVLSAFVLGGFAIPMLLNIPSYWIYSRLSLRAAFGSDPAARRGVTVQQIAKPSTVTFSNGKRVDVGMMPATISNLFLLGTALPGLVLYVLLLRRHGPEWFRSGKWSRPGRSIIDDTP